MIRSVFLFAVSMVFAFATYAQSPNSKLNPCFEKAFNDYNASKLTLLQQGAPMSMENVVAERRLEEGYCREAIRCLLGNLSNPGTKMRADVSFSTCLRDEALEKYDAKPR